MAKLPIRHEGLPLCGRLEFPWMPAVVYYCVDHQDRVLYVGVSTNLALRIGQHAARAPWWRDVAQVDWVDFHTIEEARPYEAEQIRLLDPVGNIQGRVPRGGYYEPAAT